MAGRQGHLLAQALDRLTAPRRLSRDRAGTLVVDESAPGHECGVPVYERHGAALCELIEHLPTTGWPGVGGNGCEVLVTLDLDSLLTGLDGLGVARLDGGVAITAGEARRLACSAGLVPAVLDSASMPLDLGRTRRLHTRTQRRALALTHDTCAITGCQRPFAWREIHHHRLPWSAGLHPWVPAQGARARTSMPCHPARHPGVRPSRDERKRHDRVRRHVPRRRRGSPGVSHAG